MAAPEPPDQRQIVVRLDPLGGRLHVECGREADDRRDDRRVHAARVGGAEHEALVNLDLVERCLFQIAERRIAVPKSSSASRTPVRFSRWNIARFSALSSRNTPSVISSSSCAGSTPAAATALRIVAGNLSFAN